MLPKAQRRHHNRSKQLLLAAGRQKQKAKVGSPALPSRPGGGIDHRQPLGHPRRDNLPQQNESLQSQTSAGQVPRGLPRSPERPGEAPRGPGPLLRRARPEEARPPDVAHEPRLRPQALAQRAGAIRHRPLRRGRLPHLLPGGLQRRAPGPRPQDLPRLVPAAGAGQLPTEGRGNDQSAFSRGCCAISRSRTRKSHGQILILFRN
jgi:hypothetical protein